MVATICNKVVVSVLTVTAPQTLQVSCSTFAFRQILYSEALLSID